MPPTQEVTPYTGPTYSDVRIKSAIDTFGGYEVIEKDALRHAVDCSPTIRLLLGSRGVAKWARALWDTGLC